MTMAGIFGARTQSLSDRILAALSGRGFLLPNKARRMSLPDCMMPDGAEPCLGFRELRTELDLAEKENARLLSLGQIPVEQVARIFLDDERAYYKREFDDFTVARLSEVIRRARLDGYNSKSDT